MSTAVSSQPLQRPPASYGGTTGLVVRRRLPRWAPWAIVAGCAALLAAVFALTGLDNRALFVVLLLPLYTAVLAGVSTRLEGRRRAVDRVVTVVVYSAFGLALLPLVSVLATTVARGLPRFDATFLTHSMRGVFGANTGGGAYHAIVGTLEQVGIASLISVPIGLLVAVYLVEYGRGRLARAVTFFVDVMTGVPSIVAGLFILSLFKLTLGWDYMGFLGALSLTILMLPVVVRAAEEMLKLVPNELREASLALGVPRWRTILKVVLPTALAGITTGVMLAVARVIGETAPLIVTVFFTDSINTNPFAGPQSALPLFVYTEIGKGIAPAVDRAWAGALTLIIIVMALNLIARLIARWKAPARG